ncbi:fibronectin type-III domain-containing protein 3A-like isoform X1 [Pecten maximus]|uniref:fibronectin type-III domain-containing protein 3A-like isoform X1 n=1 Tax=Pecten maximus TaxID=6579 RepID=UPI00145818A0|nr:fibronectin type-III domain-containing protein 3A-like isoform X1 [Pecten maximus]
MEKEKMSEASESDANQNCNPGMVTTTYETLKENGRLTPSEIKNGIHGNHEEPDAASAASGAAEATVGGTAQTSSPQQSCNSHLTQTSIAHTSPLPPSTVDSLATHNSTSNQSGGGTTVRSNSGHNGDVDMTTILNDTLVKDDSQSSGNEKTTILNDNQSGVTTLINDSGDEDGTALVNNSDQNSGTQLLNDGDMTSKATDSGYNSVNDNGSSALVNDHSNGDTTTSPSEGCNTHSGSVHNDSNNNTDQDQGGTTSTVLSEDQGGVNNTNAVMTHNVPGLISGSAASLHNTNGHVPPPHGGSSPNRYSPNSQTTQMSPRGPSPHNQNASAPGTSPPNHQHVVHVHVNSGETFSMRVGVMGDQFQHIQGPATVRMVSNTGPPLPMPMQVPQGHMVQQIVDEHGILTHVILSPQPPGMPVQPMTGGPNNNAPQYYQGYTPHYATHPYHHHTHPGASSHVPAGAPTHPHGTPPPPSCNSLPSGPVHTPGPSQQSSMENRTNRQREKVRKKYYQRLEEGFYNQRPPPRRSPKPKVNGEIQPGSITNTPPVDTGQDLEEERKIIQHQLSNMPEPGVTEVEARSALIHLAPPEYDQNEFVIEAAEFQYELLLSDKGKDGKYKSVYSGDATEITLKDLKPATEYHLKVCTSLEDVKGSATEPVRFLTGICEPDPPQMPKLHARTKTSITLKWNATCENGARISTYTLECDKGQGDGFTEVYNGLQRQHRVSKLQATTKYTFRLAAINSVGKSQFSDLASYCTSGSVPSQPDPPMLSETFISALTISWIKRTNEDNFLLQIEDETTGHGFITEYNGPNLSHKVKTLRRNTDYKFRLAAVNDEGQSKWSEVSCFRTLPDRPSPPPKPQIKGKIHAHSFKVVWDPPKDNGGSDITKYIVELDDGRGGGYETLYEGSDREHICDHLIPGHIYMVRVACCSKGGRSDFSDFCIATTHAVSPGQCHAPKLQGKPKATSLHLRWGYPEYDGGANVMEFTAQMINPDNTSREVFKGRDLDCIVAGLSPGRPYLFQVRAFNMVGGGPWSEPLEVVSGAGVPDPPKTPLVNCRSPHSAMVLWDSPVNNGATITDYRLEWQHKSDLDFTQLYFGSNMNYEVKGLTPATLYSFRVQAINSAGSGPFSAVATCVTPPSSPSPVVYIRHTANANTISLSWKEPNCNGSDISSYNIDIGEKQLISTSAVTEYLLEELAPESVYKVRIQAVNGIGVGAFSSPVRISTKPLPPNPSRLECVIFAPNSLKLKWGDGRNPDMVTYTLEMEREDGNFQPVYSGPAHAYKVNKLTEMSSYDFRIYASNVAGNGPYSEVFTFTTLKAPPPALKAPKIQDIQLTSCNVDWASVRPMGSDSIVYILQLQSRDHEYKQMYRGPATSYSLHTLSPKTEYTIRVCAVRQCLDKSDDVVGPFSPCVMFTTPSLEPVTSLEPKLLETKIVEPKQLTDQQWAMIILLGFVIFACLVAFVAQQIILYTSSHSARHDDL